MKSAAESAIPVSDGVRFLGACILMAARLIQDEMFCRRRGDVDNDSTRELAARAVDDVDTLLEELRSGL